jgi:5-methylcytosine-specific restriction enzyme subunit McrC
VLFDFPECDDVKVSEKLFSKLVYDRKTAGYRKAVELARIILMNFHPDFKGGRNNILAIMVNMNELWENYIYFTLARAAANNPEISISRQNSTGFWTQPDGRTRNIRPDIVVHLKQRNKSIVLDTKWKYKKDTSVEDARQMYAYGHYFNSEQGFLVYPEKLNAQNPVDYQIGAFKQSDIVLFKNQHCGLLWVDLMSNVNQLNKDIGAEIIKELPEL